FDARQMKQVFARELPGVARALPEISGNGTRFALRSESGNRSGSRLTVWESGDALPVSEREDAAEREWTPMGAAILDSDGRFLFVGAGPARLVNLNSGSDVTLDGEETLGAVAGAAFSHKRWRLAVLSSAAGGTLSIFEAATGRRLSSRAASLDGGAIQRVVFTPDDRYL